MSARYGVLPDDFYLPELSRINPQAKKNHQGSQEQVEMDSASIIQKKLQKFSELAYQTYMDLIDTGLARELARNVLPVSIYTRMYCTMNLHNLFHFLRLRMDSHAQKEIRVFAEAMFELVKDVCPEACQAFEDYQTGGVYLNRMEVAALRDAAPFALATAEAALRNIYPDITGREEAEFEEKCLQLGGIC